MTQGGCAVLRNGLHLENAHPFAAAAACMVHQCLSEDAWMTNMLGITVSRASLPAAETRQAFLEHYAAVSAERLAQLEEQPDTWFEADTRFFDTVHSRAWVLTRRIAHSAHHRGQLTA